MDMTTAVVLENNDISSTQDDVISSNNLIDANITALNKTEEKEFLTSPITNPCASNDYVSLHTTNIFEILNLTTKI
jgi:hypothetical protein